MMNKEFIPYEQALALKELGFDENVIATYYRKKLRIIKNPLDEKMPNLPFPKYVLAPLYQQAFRWFREKYGLFKQDYMFENSVQGYSFLIYDIINHVNLYDLCYNNDGELTGHGLNSYEEAELVCLRKLIELLNQNKDE